MIGLGRLRVGVEKNRCAVKRFAADEAGNAALIGAACLLMVVGIAALAVDVGTVFADKRRTQSAADLAAIVAASDLAHANSAAAATVSKNNMAPDSLVAVELGAYKADASLSPQQRFSPAASPANAVRVTLQTRTPLYFGKVLTGTPDFKLRASAIASTTRLATFAIGSRLASLNGGLLNQLLGGMLGTSLSLSAMDYQALLDARINVFDFLSALATQAHLTGVSYEALLASNVRVVDVVSALQTSAGGGTAASALGVVSSSLAGLATKIELGELIDPGPYGDLASGQKPKVAVDVAAFDLLSAAARIANGAHQIAAGVNLGLPGIAAARWRSVSASGRWAAVGLPSGRRAPACTPRRQEFFSKSSLSAAARWRWSICRSMSRSPPAPRRSTR